MNKNDASLKKTSVLVGISMLIFLALFYSVLATYELLVAPIIIAVLPNVWGNVISKLLSGIVYAAVFIIPALLFMHLNRSEDEHLRNSPKFPAKKAPFVIMATVAISLSCAYVNSFLGNVFGISGGAISDTDPVSAIDFLLLTFTMALVPAVCEEFLFRRTVLRALLPFSESFAIISSSLLFGLMHQNVLQIFYTTVAGILLGYVYAKTRSYLCVFLIHFVNNFISVLQTVFANNFIEPYSSIALASLTAAVLIFGEISAFVLILQESRKKDAYATGSFSKILEPSENFVSKDTDTAPAKIFFLSPTVLIFTMLTVLTCLLQFFL